MSLSTQVYKWVPAKTIWEATCDGVACTPVAGGAHLCTLTAIWRQKSFPPPLFVLRQLFYGEQEFGGINQDII